MPIPAEEFLDDKIIEKLHVRRRETDRWIYSVMQHVLSLYLVEGFSKPSPQFLRYVFKHFAKVTVLKFQHIDVHQQPEVVMLVDHLLDRRANFLRSARLSGSLSSSNI